MSWRLDCPEHGPEGAEFDMLQKARLTARANNLRREWYLAEGFLFGCGPFEVKPTTVAPYPQREGSPDLFAAVMELLHDVKVLAHADDFPKMAARLETLELELMQVPSFDEDTFKVGGTDD